MATPSEPVPARRPIEANSATEGTFTIGRLVRDLQGEFPDLSVSKVRYLEQRGLVSPARSKGRYRRYTSGDLRILRTVLTLQRDEFLPLDVIRQRVEKSTLNSGRPVLTTGEEAGPSSTPLRPEEALYSLEELCTATGVAPEFVLRLEESRLVERAAESGQAYTATDFETVHICRLLSRFRLEPRNLRLLSSSAEREAALVEQVATTALRSTHPDKKEYGMQIVEDLGSLFSRLNHLLLYRELRRLL
jgi:DNA-binding transcriptional MerR regulator